jgi:hypothetical protein
MAKDYALKAHDCLLLSAKAEDLEKQEIYGCF